MKTEMKKFFIVGMVAVGVIGCGVTGYFLTRNKLDANTNQETDKTNPIIKDETKPNQDVNKKPNDNKVEDDKNMEEETDSSGSSNGFLDSINKPNSGSISSPQNPVSNGSNSSKPNVSQKPSEVVTPSNPEQPVVPEKPVLPEEPEVPDVPSIPEKPVDPEDPVIPEPEKDLIITNDMLEDNALQISNKKYNTVTLSSDISSNARIVLNEVEILEDLFLEESGDYQLDLLNSKIGTLSTIENKPMFYSMRSLDVSGKNKALGGATINLDDKSFVQALYINHNLQVNGVNSVSKVIVNQGEEVILNIPANTVSLNTNGVVAVNKKIDHVINQGMGSTVVVNAPVTKFSNQASSMIHINQQNTIANLENLGENTVISGNGTLTNVSVHANNTRIYTRVTNPPVLSQDVENVLVRQEQQNQIISVSSTSQGSVTFTLAQAVDTLSINDISIICNAGKSLTLYHLSTKDHKTFTLTSSYFKNDSYALYLTLPNGNIISKDFDTDYANPTLQNVVVERISDTKATLELYGVDEGGKIYYVLEDAITREVIQASSIKQNGKSSSIKVGYNLLTLDGLKAGKSYHLYYTMEGFFGNLSKAKGPIEIPSQVKEVDSSKYQIVYAKEEIENRFVFQLNRVPERELTLEDFEIICPSEKNLTTKGATFMVSPDLLTYIIVVPDNYGHKDNKYTVRINVSETETVEGSFVSHFDPPVITGAVDNVVRVDENTANFSFYSDEEGIVYYGVYEWNGGIYDTNTSTPFAHDVITGVVKSKKQDLYAGSNTILLDLTDISVTKNTRVWALFVDAVGNYRVGFVDHYKIPENVVEEIPDSESSLKITNFKMLDNNSISIDFNEMIGWVSSDDIQISVLENGSLPSKLLFSIDNDTSKHLSIDLLNYELPSGVYELKLNLIDKNEQEVIIKQRIEIP